MAAKLIHCKFEPSVGLLCVVTEYVPRAVGETRQISEDGVKALRKGLNLLHNKSLVFGDLRDANIILDKEGWPHVIDFDWCGVSGKVRYPFDINDEPGMWMDGVEGGNFIEKRHDLDMLDKYLRSFN